METGLKFWPHLLGETGYKKAKTMQFSKIGLKTTQKPKRMNQMSTQPFWGVFREVFRVRS